MSETKPEVTEEDLKKVMKRTITEFLREHQREIVRRAHARIREIAKEEAERKDA